MNESLRSDCILHLSLGLDILLNYNEEETKIMTVQLSKSRFGELIRNNIVTSTSILDVQKTRSNR